jgi:hypothetical protein
MTDDRSDDRPPLWRLCAWAVLIFGYQIAQTVANRARLTARRLRSSD